jgi:hypothetical protein
MLQPVSNSSTNTAPPQIKLVAIDLDGTLLTKSKTVCERAAKALRCMPANGVKIVIASARPPRSVRAIYQELGLDTWTINYNGALIWDEVAGESGGQAVFHRPMNGKLVQGMIERSRDMFEEVLVSCEVMDRWFTDREDQTYTTETGRLFSPDVICTIEQMCGQPITKLMLLGDPRILLRLEPILLEESGGKVTIVHTDDDLIQIMDNRVSKAIALQKVAHHYGVPMSQVLAIGDAPNDVGMLQLAGVAVAMENAKDVVKEVADWIAPSNNDAGVHAALQHFGLCE